MTEVAMTREQAIGRLMWNHGGAGMGVCAVGNLLAAMGSGRRLPSCVAVSGPAENYTDEELAKLVEFSDAKTRRHIEICGSVLEGDNLTCIGKLHGGRWLSKKQSWDFGRMFSDSLDDAIAFLADA